MPRYRSSRLLPAILVTVIAVIVIVAVVSLVRVIFFSGSSTPQVDVGRQALLDTSPTHSVTVTVRGPIVADEDFHSYQITVGPNIRNLTTYSGYLDTAIDTVTLDNNVSAYQQFVHALDNANLTKGTQLTGEANDTLGRCATGRLYDFQILDGSTVVKDLWTSSCSGSRGSLDASVSQLLNLFQVQIPNAQATLQKVGLQDTIF